MTDVFISYAHEDHDYVRRMAPALEAEGFTVWWDHTIPPGKTWDEVIAKGIADARCCIVLWSKSSVVSDWVKEEATIAKDHRKFIPVQIDNSEPPVGFRRIQAAHLQNWNGNVSDPQWQMLAREIRSVVSTARASGAATGEAPAAQSYAPRAYQPQQSYGEPAAGGASRGRMVGIIAGVAALLAVGVISFVMMNRDDAPQTTTEAPQYQVQDPAAAPATGQSAELERLRRERDDALRRVEEERLARQREARPTPAATASATGRWSGTYSWTTGAGGPLSIDIRSSGQAQANDFSPWSWTQDGARVVFTEQSGNRWTGVMRGDVISGTMRRYDGSATGTFEIRRGGGAPVQARATGTYRTIINWDSDVNVDMTVTLHSDGRMTNSYGENGTWTQSGSQVRMNWTALNGNRLSATATLSGTTVSGRATDHDYQNTGGALRMTRQ